jgi:hypothetical protein
LPFIDWRARYVDARHISRPHPSIQDRCAVMDALDRNDRRKLLRMIDRILEPTRDGDGEG